MLDDSRRFCPKGQTADKLYTTRFVALQRDYV